MNSVLPKVSVVTITYGHEKYITETLDGVLMQQYDGPVEFIIANDNSPDATDEVVKKYFLENPAPSNFEIKYTKHETNKGMMPNFIWALEQATGKYIALCEGDDYWTDPLKIRKQVDFLEKNQDCSMIFTSANVLIEVENGLSNSTRGLEKIEKSRFFLKSEILDNWVVPTASVMFRSQFNDSEYYTLAENNKFIYGDIVLFLYLACKGKIYGLADTTVAYRRHIGGITNVKSSIEFDRKYYDHLQELIEKFGKELKSNKIKLILSRLSLSLGLYELKNGKKSKGITLIAKSLKFNSRPCLLLLKNKL